jgi:hypothetical protein
MRVAVINLVDTIQYLVIHKRPTEQDNTFR